MGLEMEMISTKEEVWVYVEVERVNAR